MSGLLLSQIRECATAPASFSMLSKRSSGYFGASLDVPLDVLSVCSSGGRCSAGPGGGAVEIED